MSSNRSNSQSPRNRRGPSIRKRLSALTLASMVVLGTAHAVSFTPGNVVIYRIGNGAAGLLNTGAPVFLDEYSPGGTLVQSVAMPATASGAQKQLVASGTASSEGLLVRSLDGKHLVLTGYASNIPAAGSLSATASASTNRTIGRVDALGNVDTSTALTDFADANNPRCAISTNGTDFWMTGGAGGVRYTTFGATTSTQVSSTVVNLRNLGIYGGQLFVSTASGTAFRVGSVGTGLPTTTGQVIANLPGAPTTGSANQFFLADLSASAPGYDTLYVADDTNSAGVGGIQKYALVGNSWVSKGTIGTPADAYRGLSGTVVGGSVTLIGVRKGGAAAAGGGELFSVTDASGYNATITGTPTVLASSGTNKSFRGVASAPVVAPDLSVTATGPASATVGGSFSYTLTVSNSGADAASGVDVNFTLPSGVTFTSATGGGFTASESSGVVALTGGSLAAGTNAVVTVTVTPTVPGTFSLPAWAAVVDPANAIAEVDESNNKSLFPVTTLASLVPDLTVSYTAPAQAVKDVPFDYTITAGNSGLASASGVTVQFTLPPGVTFSSGAGTGFTVSQAAGVVTFSGGSIATGTSANLTVTATASPTTPTAVTATAGAAVIDPANTIEEASEANNVSTAAVTTFVRLFPLPTAAGDSYSTLTNVPLSVNAATGLLANDSSTSLTFVVSSQPAHGTVSLNPDGSFAYTPTPGYTGPDSFTYKVTDAVQKFMMSVPPLGTFGGITVTGDGYGSAIQPVAGTTDEFWGMTDRGANVDGLAENSKIIAIPSFAPSIARFKLANGVATIQGGAISLKTSDGTPFSGRTNSANPVIGETLFDTAGNLLTADPNGFDPEGLAVAADGTFWVSDEYGPFISHFDAAGFELQRLSPITGSLPVELRHRTTNRGMEGLAITPDGTMLVGIMQSALSQPDHLQPPENLPVDATKIAPTRIVTYTIATGEVHEYLYMLANPNTNNKNTVSDITAISNTEFLVDERDNGFPPSASKKFYKINIAGATDVGPLSTVPSTTYESTGDMRGLLIGGNSIEKYVGLVGTTDAAALLATAGIAPVSKTLHFDHGALISSLDSTGRFYAHDKVEGAVLTNGGNSLVIANDSDFGIGGLSNGAAPFTFGAKTAPTTPTVVDKGEFLVVDLTRLPAATVTATVALNVAPASDPVVQNGAATIADGQVAAVDFGSVNVLGNASQTFTIQNAGSAELTGNTITIDGANAGDFSVTTAPSASVAAGDHSNCVVAFAPTAAGPRSATLHIASNAPGDKSSYDFPLTGTGVVMPNLTVTMVHNGAFHQRDNGDTFTITASNIGTAPTDGSAVTAVATLPAGFVPAASNNGTVNGWAVSVSGQTVTATRSGALAAGASFPAINVAVNVSGAAGTSLVSSASVAGGGDTTPGDNATNETTSVNPPLPVTFMGVASGDADSSSAVLWTRINETQSVTLTAEVAADAAFTSPVGSFAIAPDPARDYTAKASATGLAPGSTFFYRFVVDGTGEISGTGTFKTVPLASAAVGLKFAFSGDCDGLIRPYALASQVPSKHLDFFMFDGDTIYETSASIGSPAITSTGNIPAPSSTGATQAQLIADFSRKYREQFFPVNPGGQACLKDFFAGQANYTMLDNHELGNKQYINGGAPAGGSVGDMATGRGVDARVTANDVTPNDGSVAFMNKSTGFQTLVQTYLDHQPIKDRGTISGADARANGTKQLYFAQQWGKHAVLVNVDDRTYRDIRLKTAANVDDTGVRADNPSRTILGATQLAWLKQSLLDAHTAGTTWKFVNISDPIDQIGPIGGDLTLLDAPTIAEYGTLGTVTSIVTAAATTASTSVTLTASPVGVVPGQPVSGAGVTSGTTVKTINPNGTLTLSAVASIPAGTTLTLAPAPTTYIPVSNDGGKSWIGGYRAERNDLLKFIADNHITNVVFMATDDHQNRINEVTYSPTGQTGVQSSYVKVPQCFSVVCGPFGATGPDLISNHTYGLAKKLADSIANAEVTAGIEPIGLAGYPGLSNVSRFGHAGADTVREPSDFYSPDTFNYNMFEVSPDGLNLTITSYGIDATVTNAFAEYDALNNPEKALFSFQVNAYPDPVFNSATFAGLNIARHGATIDLAAVTGASPTGGTFSGAGVTGGLFDPSATTPGAKTITYSYTDLLGAPHSSTFSITVAKDNQSLVFALTSPVSMTDSVVLNATPGASGEPVTYSIVSGPGSIVGNVLTFTGAGTVTVRASEAGNSEYSAAPDVDVSITVSANHGPIAVDDAITSTTGTTIVYPLANDIDAEGNELTITAVSNPGVIIDGRVLILPVGYTGTFTYTVSDGISTDTADVVVTGGSTVSGARRFTGLLNDSAGKIVGRATMSRSAAGLNVFNVRIGSATGIRVFTGTSAIGQATTAGPVNVTLGLDNRVAVSMAGGVSGSLRPSVTTATIATHHVGLASVNAAIPGAGIGRVNVTALGLARFSLKMPDGKGFLTSAEVSDNGSINFYGRQNLTMPAGFIGGEFILANLAKTDLTGEMEWVKPAQATGLQRAGVNTVLVANGCVNTGVFGIPDGPAVVTLSGGNFPAPVVINSTVLNGKVAAVLPTLRGWSAQTLGQSFRTTFKQPGFVPLTLGEGLFFPKSHTALGFFPGTTLGGKIELRVP